MTDDTGLQLGERTHIPWACGPTRSLRVWRDVYRQMDPDELAVAVGTARGIHARRAEIEAAIPAGWRTHPIASQFLPSDVKWLGQFTPRGIPLVVAGLLLDSSIQFFSITGDSRLKREDAVIDPLLPWQRLRIIGLQGKAWHLDPVVEQAQDWRLWIWEGRSLTEVEWDPGEWRWPPLDAS